MLAVKPICASRGLRELRVPGPGTARAAGCPPAGGGSARADRESFVGGGSTPHHQWEKCHRKSNAKAANANAKCQRQCQCQCERQREPGGRVWREPLQQLPDFQAIVQSGQSWCPPGWCRNSAGGVYRGYQMAAAAGTRKTGPGCPCRRLWQTTLAGWRRWRPLPRSMGQVGDAGRSQYRLPGSHQCRRRTGRSLCGDRRPARRRGGLDYWLGMLKIDPARQPNTHLLMRVARKIGEAVVMVLKVFVATQRGPRSSVLPSTR